MDRNGLFLIFLREDGFHWDSSGSDTKMTLAILWLGLVTTATRSIWKAIGGGGGGLSQMPVSGLAPVLDEVFEVIPGPAQRILLVHCTAVCHILPVYDIAV